MKSISTQIPPPDHSAFMLDSLSSEINPIRTRGMDAPIKPAKRWLMNTARVNSIWTIESDLKNEFNLHGLLLKSLNRCTSFWLFLRKKTFFPSPSFMATPELCFEFMTKTIEVPSL